MIFFFFKLFTRIKQQVCEFFPQTATASAPIDPPPFLLHNGPLLFLHSAVSYHYFPLSFFQPAALNLFTRTCVRACTRTCVCVCGASKAVCDGCVAAKFSIRRWRRAGSGRGSPARITSTRGAQRRPVRRHSGPWSFCFINFFLV